MLCQLHNATVSPSYAEVPGRVSVSAAARARSGRCVPPRPRDGQIGRRRAHGAAAFAVGEQLFCGLVEAVAVDTPFSRMTTAAAPFFSSTRAFFS